MGRATIRMAVALAAGAALAWTLASCGSGEAAEEARTAARTATAAVTQTDKTVTETRTATVTQPQKTVTDTATVTSPPKSATVTVAHHAQTPTTGDDSGDGGLEWWGWVLIGLAIAGVGIAIFALGRRSRGDDTAST